MSTAPGVAPPPHTPATVPGVAPRKPMPPRSKRSPIVLAGLIAIVGLGYFLWTRQNAQPASGPAGVTALRTATAFRGDVVRTVRLTGSTAAERFASLLVPQLRGSRSDTLRQAKTFTTPGSD